MAEAKQQITEHPFAPFIRALGKGRKGSRSLSQDEAFQAMQMILQNKIEPMQLGAFLMLLRVKEETAEELAGFTQAMQQEFPAPANPSNLTSPQLDWPCYAGKRRQLPWFLLAALLLAKNGIRVLMHGTDGFDPSRIFMPQALAAMGITPADNLATASEQLQANNFAYLRLEAYCPILGNMLQYRSILGLRSPVHSLVRMLNPLRAQASMVGIFHPGYRDVHQEAARLLAQPRFTVIKGEGGEAERSPDVPCQVKQLIEGQHSDTTWPALLTQRPLKDESMDINRLQQVWLGKANDTYGEAAVIATTAVALATLGLAPDAASADAQASLWWQQRN